MLAVAPHICAAHTQSTESHLLITCIAACSCCSDVPTVTGFTILDTLPTGETSLPLSGTKLISLTGTYFGSSINSATSPVTVGGLDCATPVVKSATEIQCTAPAATVASPNVVVKVQSAVSATYVATNLYSE